MCYLTGEMICQNIKMPTKYIFELLVEIRWLEIIKRRLDAFLCVRVCVYANARACQYVH